MQELFFQLLKVLFNKQNKKRGREVAELHYELDLDLFMSFLDPYNQYTCGYFKDTDDLNVAQELKLDLICRKLYLKPEDKVLDIGCGWGGFAKFASERYGSHVTGISIADVQIGYARGGRLQKLSALYGGRARQFERRRAVPPAHHRPS